jgi:hypothetical protein
VQPVDFNMLSYSGNTAELLLRRDGQCANVG